MPDKRDMHQAKSHRNSRNNKASRRQSASEAQSRAQREPGAVATGAAEAEPLRETPTKRNKSMR